MQFFLGLVDAGDIGEADLDVFLDEDLGLALADRHDRAEALAHASREQAPDEKENRDRHDPGEQRRNPGVFDGAGIFDLRGFQFLGEVGVDAHGEHLLSSIRHWLFQRRADDLLADLDLGDLVLAQQVANSL